jgi:predicted negative regulator of RcsB-dependent stress response
MSTNGLTSWAVDLKDIGAIYPFQGTETVLVVIGVTFWIAWHVWQLRHENRELEQEVKRLSAERTRKAIDRY